MDNTTIAQNIGSSPPGLLPLIEFFSDVLPPPQDGKVFVAGSISRNTNGEPAPMMHTNAATHEELALAVLSGPGDAYFGLAQFTPHTTKTGSPGRQGKYADYFKSLWLDIDCGQDKATKQAGYATVKEVKPALQAMLKKTGLPLPTRIASSGTGLHVYWALEEAITAEQWQVTATQLKALLAKCGFLADPARTADRASVLRPPGTFNHKTNPPLPVRLILHRPCISYESFRQAVEAAHAMLCAPQLTSAAASVANAIAATANSNAANINDLTEALRFISPDSDETTWKMTCIAPLARLAVSHPAQAAELKALAIAWSRGDLHNLQASKWKGDADFETHWQRFITDTRADGITTIASIFYLAKQNGWQPATLPLSDTGNAGRLVAYLHGHMRFVHGLRLWLRYAPAEHRWLFCHKGEPVEAAKALMRKMLDEATKIPDDEKRKRHIQFALKSQELARITAMLKLTESDPAVALDAAELDQDPWSFCVRNGMIDLRTGQLRASSPNDLATKQAGTDYDPSATCPLFEQTLMMAFAGDQSLIDYFQRVCGYLLFGGIREQLFFFCHGAGANGKSTILNIIQSVMGDYAVSLPTETLMAGKRDATAASPDLMMLRGARLALATETEDGHRLAEARVKQLTGGDSITARALYGSFVTFPPTAKLVMVGNHKPQIIGVDVAIWRRVQQIPFEVTIPANQRDPRLPDKLLHEMPGILAWMVIGCIAWQQQGLTPPAAVMAATNVYKAESDLLGEWLTECCNQNPFAVAPVRDLYPAYRNWVMRNGHQPWSSTRWGRLMAARFTKARNTSGQTTYAGIDLNPYGRTLTVP
jgi:putative DNA primase/helicase